MARTYDKDFENLRRELDGVSSRVSQLRQRLDAVPAAVLIVDDTGRYVAANVQACTLTGFSRDELLQKSISDLTAPTEIPVFQPLWDAFLRTTRQHGLYALRCNDHSVVPVEYRAYSDLAPGLHISFLTRASAVAAGARSLRHPDMCKRCRSANVAVLSVSPSAIWWWCSDCGFVQGLPQR